ncbi:MAG: N-acetylglutaminylglutamine synthetase, partial [Oceanicaulis sp.]
MKNSDQPRKAMGHRLKRLREHALKSSGPPRSHIQTEAEIDVGWGRLIFAQTFDDAERLVTAIRDEKRNKRD